MHGEFAPISSTRVAISGWNQDTPQPREGWVERPAPGVMGGRGKANHSRNLTFPLYDHALLPVGAHNAHGEMLGVDVPGRWI